MTTEHDDDDDDPGDGADDTGIVLDSRYAARVATVAVVAVAVLGCVEAVTTGRVSTESYAALGAALATVGFVCRPRP